MEEYIANEESYIESQGKWSQSSQWIEDMRISNFKSKQTFVSKMLHNLNLLFSSSSIFCHPPMQV